MDINLVLDPKKVLEFTDPNDPTKSIKIHLEGTTPIQESYIEGIRFQKLKTQKERMRAGADYVRAVLCNCIKKVEDCRINGKDWNVTFSDENPNEINEESYNTLMRIFTVYLNADIHTPITSFYSSLEKHKVENVEVELKKKEKAKKQ